MKISMLVPTRERPAGLERFLKSVYNMTLDKSRLEILVACDEDDDLSKTYTTREIEKYQNKLDIKMYTRPRSQMLNADYYNFLSSKTDTELKWVLADDVVLLCPGWDEMLFDHLKRVFSDHPDKIYCVGLKDSTPPPSHKYPKFPCYPLITKQAIEAIGFLLYPDVPNWGQDFLIYCLYKPIGRLIEFSDRNFLDHISHHTHRCPPDKTAINIGRIFNSLKMKPEHNVDDFIEKRIPILRNHLKQKIASFYGKHAREMEWPVMDLSFIPKKGG